MFKFLKDRKKDNKGFTLVELVIVVAILAILVGILAPQYTKYVEKSRKSADVSNLENCVTAFKTACADGTSQIPAGKYQITINTNGTFNTAAAADAVKPADGKDIKADSTDKNGKIAATAIKEFTGSDLNGTKLKSTKWTTTENGTDTVTYIAALCIVDNNGATSVVYEPTWVKDLSSK